ncbi:MAG: DMT family transporter [Proteobacteria bacterium]|nr:DMT family transporter [Pseudomonadota bacterium]
MNRSEWALLLILGGLWGGSFFFNSVAMRELPPLTFVALRVVLAGALLLLAMRVRRLPFPRSRAVWAVALGMGVLNAALPWTLISWGQIRVPAGAASTLQACTPLFTVLLAHALTRDEKLTGGKIAGVLFGLVGVGVMIGPDALGGLTRDFVSQAAIVLAAVSYAGAAVLSRRFAALGVAPLAAATGQVLCAAVLLLPLALAVDHPWALPPISLEAWGAVISIAVLSTTLAYVLLFRLVATAGASNASLVTLLVPVSAILLGALFLGERIEAGQMAGMALIGVGLLISDGRLGASLLRRGRPIAGGAA